MSWCCSKLWCLGNGWNYVTCKKKKFFRFWCMSNMTVLTDRFELWLQANFSRDHFSKKSVPHIFLNQCLHTTGCVNSNFENWDNSRILEKVENLNLVFTWKFYIFYKIIWESRYLFREFSRISRSQSISSLGLKVSLIHSPKCS